MSIMLFVCYCSQCSEYSLMLDKLCIVAATGNRGASIIISWLGQMQLAIYILVPIGIMTGQIYLAVVSLML